MGMLSAYSYELNILKSATSLIRNDAFRAVDRLNGICRRAQSAAAVKVDGSRVRQREQPLPFPELL